jgi:predicted ATPase/DNA-binding winged helix-turn-helix (wHTH) protein
LSRSAEQFYTFGSFQLDRVERQLLREGAPVPLTGKVFDLLELLAMNSGRALSKQELMNALWPNVVVEENNLAVHIAALGDLSSERLYIETLPRRGYRFVVPVTPVAASALRSSTLEPTVWALPRSLPVQTTPFVGRDAELARLVRLLADPEHRLVTLLAPGGMGKSRLALEAGRVLASGVEGFRPAVVWVELAALGSSELLASAIAQAFGFESWAGENLAASLSRVLAGQPALLVLDNFEPVLAGAPFLSQLLERVPGLTLLVTSREALRLQIETLLPLLGLSAPQADSTTAALELGSVRLFVQSAARLGVDLRARPEDIQAAARICGLLEGLPLGILLAASWVNVLSVQEIEAEMRHSLDFLHADLLDLPERQRSLQAVFAQTWQLLDPDERGACCALSVFRGGFTRSAAETVADAVPATLARLSNKSLLWREQHGGRYQVHELLRQYAGQRLQQSDSEFSVRDRHADYFARYLEAREPILRASNPASALRDIEIEIGNVRAAFRWLLERQQMTGVSRSIEALNLFYERRAAHGEAVSVFSDAATGLSGSSESTTHETAKVVRMALRSLAAHASRQGPAH